MRLSHVAGDFDLQLFELASALQNRLATLEDHRPCDRNSKAPRREGGERRWMR